MNASPARRALTALILQLAFQVALTAGTWTDHFHESGFSTEWTGKRDSFRLTNGFLEGRSASPLASPLNFIEILADSADYDVSCWINLVEPNLRVCTKGALLLRHSGTNGYVFALHEPTQTIEVYRLADGELLLTQNAPIHLRRWYNLHVELRGATMTFFVDGSLIGRVTDTQSLSGSVGIAVQDAEVAWFDDFTVSGGRINGNVDFIPRPKLNLVTPAPAHGVLFRFQAEPPYDYLVQASSAPFAHPWETLQTYRAKLQPFLVEFSEPITNGSTRFYRVEKILCECD